MRPPVFCEMTPELRTAYEQASPFLPAQAALRIN